MDIDVRTKIAVEKIIFGEFEEHLFLSGEFCDRVVIQDCDEDLVYIQISDIPNLIKALQKAQEVWGEK